MSKSYHVTRKNFKGKTKEKLNEMADDPYSELREWAKKSQIKKDIKKQRKINKQEKQDIFPSNIFTSL